MTIDALLISSSHSTERPPPWKVALMSSLLSDKACFPCK